MPSEADPMNAVVRSLVGLAKYAETSAALEAFSRLPVTDAENVCEVDDTAETLGMGRGQIVYWFKQLASAGCGRFIVGRRGGHSRFEWWFDPVSVYNAALKLRNDLAPLSAPDQGSVKEDWDALVETSAEEEDDDGTGEAPDATEANIEHIFMLRPGFPVRLVLPESLTKVEAERLSSFVKTLPFL